MRLTALFILLFLFACRKETFTTNPDDRLRVDVDTLHFDTVFTSTGSVTQAFKIFNDNKKGVHLSAVQLKGGISSAFKINVNGQTGPSVSNIDIADGDSAYVFVSVQINPSMANLPFVVRDSIEVAYNGNTKLIQLEAYGRDAHFFRSRVITGNEVWNNDKPYVIIGGLEIAPNAKLTINKGCQIFAHADAPLIVNGSLQVLGEKWDSTRVMFTGDRLDEPYKNYPASWPGIFLNGSSKDNVFKYAVVKNAYQAIVVQSPSSNNNAKLTLSETIIDNAYDAGLLGANTSIKAQNVLINNSGKNLVLVSGGNYEFNHCTVTAFSNYLMPHKDPLLTLSDYFNESAPNSLSAVFRNCIFWGDGGQVDHEVQVLKKGNAFNVQFNNILWKQKEIPANTIITNASSEDPLFETPNTEKNSYDLRLKENSPALNKGINTSITLDLDGNKRPVGAPDLGAYEKQ